MNLEYLIQICGRCVCQGCPDYLGRAITHPQVNLDAAQSAPVILQWSAVKKGPTDGGELLFAAELFLVSITSSSSSSSSSCSFIKGCHTQPNIEAELNA